MRPKGFIWFLSLSLSASYSSAIAQQQPISNSGQPQVAPSVGVIKIPLVTPSQADTFLAARSTPPSKVPATIGDQTANETAPVALDIPNVLGHDLPTDATTPAGFPRADFAIAKSAPDKKQDALGAPVKVNPKQTGTAIIREEPPTIGKP